VAAGEPGRAIAVADERDGARRPGVNDAVERPLQLRGSLGCAAGRECGRGETRDAGDARQTGDEHPAPAASATSAVV
jgi:hypothetical protein